MSVGTTKRDEDVVVALSSVVVVGLLGDSDGIGQLGDSNAAPFAVEASLHALYNNVWLAMLWDRRTFYSGREMYFFAFLTAREPPTPPPIPAAITTTAKAIRSRKVTLCSPRMVLFGVCWTVFGTAYAGCAFLIKIRFCTAWGTTSFPACVDSWYGSSILFITDAPGKRIRAWSKKVHQLGRNRC